MAFLVADPLPPTSTLFPYTTLFRSDHDDAASGTGVGDAKPGAERQRLVRGREFRADTRDRKSTRLNSSHLVISYAVFCLKKKKTAESVVANSLRLALTLRTTDNH